MARHLFTFPCPCCGKKVEIDTRTGKARAIDPKEARGGGDLDTLLDKHRHEGERLGKVFEEARGDQTSEADRLDRMFRKAAEEAKDDPDEKPRNPFDLE